VLRSLPSITLRYRAHDEAARQLAQWLAARPEIEKVLHPALEDSPGHHHWKALCGASDAAAGLFSVVFDPKFREHQVHAFCDALKFFRLGFSWGGPMSLVVPYDVGGMRPAGRWNARGVLVRFSIGFEAIDDLRNDLEQALQQLHR